jgi:uncharacterized protein YcbX
VRRFRPNVVIAIHDSVAGEFPEQNWLGRHVRIGDIEVEINLPCPRCVMVTRDFADLPHDRDVLRTVVLHADQRIGVYANIVQPGTLQMGSPVTLV